MARALFPLLSLVLVACSGASPGTLVDSTGAESSTPPASACTSGATQACSGTDVVGTQTCHDGVWDQCKAAACSGDTFTCTTPSGGSGVAECSDGRAASACAEPGGCDPADPPAPPDCGPGGTGGIQCECPWQCEIDSTGFWNIPPCDTPLVLAFDRQPVQFTDAPGQFDLAGRQASVGMRWVSDATPWLALDRDDSGSIDDGRELFGSMTVLPGGARADNGFAALAALDDDHDGRITERDPAFSRLVLWRDRNQDRKSTPDELETLRDAGVVAIDLGYHVSLRCTGGDCEAERASFVYRDARGHEERGDVVDVRFAER